MLAEATVGDPTNGFGGSEGGPQGVGELGTDFLELPSENPLDLLERFAMGGVSSFHKRLSPEEIEQPPTVSSIPCEPIAPPPSGQHLLDFLNEAQKVAEPTPAELTFDFFFQLASQNQDPK
jgi:hypothetical protein